MDRHVLWRTLLALGIIGFLGCVLLMSRRIADDLRAHPRPLFLFRVIDQRAFSYAGRHVSLTDVTVEGVPYVTLAYGEQKVQLHATRPGKFDLPGLGKHEDWLRVLSFIDSTGMDPDKAEELSRAGKIPDRLVVVTKSLRAGANPESWGEVWKHDWVFEFYELLPDGTIQRQRSGYPSPASKVPRNDELQEGTWQYTAALHLMPKGGPTLTFRQSPVAAAGWTLPAAAFSAVLAIVSLVAGYRRPAERA